MQLSDDEVLEVYRVRLNNELRHGIHVIKENVVHQLLVRRFRLHVACESSFTICLDEMTSNTACESVGDMVQARSRIAILDLAELLEKKAAELRAGAK